VLIGEKYLVLFTFTRSPQANCPLCQSPSDRLHSYYTRRLLDLPWADFEVSLFIQARRFYCLNQNCQRQTFAERLGQAIPAYARSTQRRTNRLVAIGLALGGEAGSRLAKKLGIGASPDTILNLIKRLILPSSGPVRVLGIDEFAFRRGRRYGTILVDLEKQIVVDLLPDIDKPTIVEWLAKHPELEVLSRDRASVFAEAGRLAAPQAVQIADRFHLAQNLWEACEEVLKPHYPHLRQLLKQPGSGPGVAAPSQEESTLLQTVLPVVEFAGINQAAATSPGPKAVPVIRERPQTTRLAQGSELSQLSQLDRKEQKKQATLARRQALYEEVTRLQAAGLNHKAIALELGLDLATVKKYLKGPPQPIRKAASPSKLDPYKAYLKRRYFEDHFDNAKRLWEEIVAQGFSGGYNGVNLYLAQLRIEQGGIELTGKRLNKQIKPLEEVLPSVRQLTWAFFLPVERLKSKPKAQLNLILGKVPELAKAYQLVQGFGKLLRERQEAGLNAWLEAVGSSKLEPLVSFGRGVKRDEAAVRAGLTSPYSQGQTEGQVNRLKLVKRQMYGRADFELLRIRVLAG
jgi:transposase